MFSFLVRFCLLAALVGQLPLKAHEFWLAPVQAPLVAGEQASLSLQVGEYFTGDVVGFSAPQTASFSRYTAAGRQNLAAMLPPTPVAALQLPLMAAGTQLVAFDSQPHTISLSADSFHGYLHDEGLDFIKARREANGTATQPGRERYRRYVKTLLHVDNAAAGPATVGNGVSSKLDMTYATVVGQRLELLPLNDPLALGAGGGLGLQVLFEGKPLAGALLKAWHKRGRQTVMVRATTGGDGQTMFDLPYAGAWMVSVVHMVPAVGAQDADWESLWGSITFTLAARGKP
jgi:hypothetical protein